MISLRNSSSFFFSLLIHAAIISGAVALYNIASESLKQVKQNKPLCLCLSQVKIEPVVPKELPLPKELPPVVPKVVETEPKIVPKPVVKKIEKPAPKIKKIIKKPQPVVVEKVEEPPVIVEEILPQASPVAVEPQKVQPSTPSPKAPSPKEQYLEEHLQIIAQLLRQHLYYPVRARKRHVEGEVIVVFELLQNGNIGAVSVKQGAQDILNSAAIKTINKLSGKVPKPSESISIEIPIQFKLTS
jgi:protein TonB